MRLLVLDGSRMLPSLVKRLVPAEVVVESAGSFEEAHARLQQRPPEALIVNLTPADLPWRELQLLCERHSPPIPVLYESCVHSSPVEAGLEALGSGRFLEKPYSLASLEREIRHLLAAAAGDREPPVPEERRKPKVEKRR